MQTLAGERDIEILLFMDNKKRSIGAKREAVKNISKGKYFMFCDDDDWINSIDEVYQACQQDVDVITFKSECRNADGTTYIATFGLGNKVEHNTDGNGNYTDIKRPPFHQCAWNGKFRKIKYPDVSYGEDWVWVKQALKKATSEHFVDEIIHQYNFDAKVTEASVESNKFWKNPNMEDIRRATVNFSTPEYFKGQTRQVESLIKYSKGGEVFYTFKPDTLLCPKHEENPYAFKIYAIEQARSEGYNQVLWLDSSVYCAADPSPVWDWLTDKGIFFEAAGHYAGSWCPDHVLEYFNVTRGEAMKMPMFAAGYCGFDFRNPISVEFFAQWKESMFNGMFKGSWTNHRHDMTCGSIIANKMGLLPLYSPGGRYFSYIGQAYGPPLPTSVFHLKGL